MEPKSPNDQSARPPAQAPKADEAKPVEPEKRPDKPGEGGSPAQQTKPPAAPVKDIPLADAPKDLDDTVQVKPEVPTAKAPAEAGNNAPSQSGDAGHQPRMQPATVSMPAAGRMNPLPPPPAVTRSPSGKLLDRKVAYRRWLESKSKGELIELIMSLEEQDPALEITEKMIKTPTTPLHEPPQMYQVPDDLHYIHLPLVRKSADKEPVSAWQIILVNIDQGQKPLGLWIDAEISIGRTAGDVTPDLDLSPYGAGNKGVSRLHARMRPLPNTLVVIDEKSTNGTFCNRSQITPGVEQTLKDGDVIGFGKVNFMLKIVKSPDTKEKKTKL